MGQRRKRGGNAGVTVVTGAYSSNSFFARAPICPLVGARLRRRRRKAAAVSNHRHARLHGWWHVTCERRIHYHQVKTDIGYLGARTWAAVSSPALPVRIGRIA